MALLIRAAFKSANSLRWSSTNELQSPYSKEEGKSQMVGSFNSFAQSDESAVCKDPH